jgi:hypothetical protein
MLDLLKDHEGGQNEPVIIQNVQFLGQKLEIAFIFGMDTDQ